MGEWEILQRLLLITAIAGAVGLERERHGRAAGFRTHILVGLGSCLVMLTGLYLTETMAGRVALDPTRMAAQVISGIGFLGAGTILQFRASVRGLTTAASLWAVGGVGLAVGAGFLYGAALCGLIILLVTFGLSPIERAIRKEWYQTLVIETSGTGRQLAHIRRLLDTFDLEIRDFQIEELAPPDHVRVELQVKLLSPHVRDEIVAQLSTLEPAAKAHWA
jgi:putative Mg2+ transporter-C (MgtC) family protein